MKILNKQSANAIYNLIYAEILKNKQDDLVKNYTSDNRLIYDYTYDGKKYLPYNLDLYIRVNDGEKYDIKVDDTYYLETNIVKEILNNEDKIKPTIESLIEKIEITDNEIFAKIKDYIISDIEEEIDYNQHLIFNIISNKEKLTDEQILRYDIKYKNAKNIIDNNDELSKKLLQLEAAINNISVEELANIIINLYEQSETLLNNIISILDSVRIYYKKLSNYIYDINSLTNYLNKLNQTKELFKILINSNDGDIDNIITDLLAKINTYTLSLDD